MQKTKILVVNDGPQSLTVLRDALCGTDAEVMGAANAEQALALSLDHDFALAILDNQVAGMDAFGLARGIRKQDKNTSLPIIFLLTTYSDFLSAFHGDELVAMDCLIQPFDPNMLREKVKIFVELDGYRSRLDYLVEKRTDILRLSNENLSHQKVFLESVLESLTFRLVVIDPSTFEVEMSNSAAKRYSEQINLHSPESHKCFSFLHSDSSFCNRGKSCPLAVVVESGQAISVEYSRKSDQSGVKHYYELKGYPIFDATGKKVTKIIESITDITERKLAEDSQRIAAEAIDNVMEGILVVDTAGVIEFANPAFFSATGYKPSDVIGRHLSFLKSEKHSDAFYQQIWRSLKMNGLWRGEVWSNRKSGESYPQWLSVTGIKDKSGMVTHYVGASRDITLIKEAEEEIKYQAYHDPLTHLPNRLLFRDRLQHAIARALRKKGRIAVLFIDLDHFKNFNDSLGHTFGDHLLQVVAEKFVSCVREGDTVARIGGDEFTVIMEDIGSDEDVVVVANKLIGIFDEHINVNGENVYLGASIGISIYPDDGEDVESLTKLADTAMYSVKDEGRNGYRFFTPDMERRIIERVNLEHNLRVGLDRHQFRVHYQPVVDIRDGCIVGMEALVRWDKPGDGLMLPERFIPLAEARGLIVPIGEWVLRQACGEGGLWHSEGCPTLNVSVNLSARQFREKDLVSTVKSVLNETQLEPNRLILEITETIIMADIQASVSIMHQLKEMGVRLSMDDFGTGYSSFNYLKEFPVDYLKLDYLFIKDITTDKSAGKIAVAIISLAKDLGLTVVAEGVETAEQLNFLRSNGCDLVQGFYFSRPVSGGAFDELLKQPFR